MLLIVPLTLNVLDNEKYGIWITVYSLVNWFNMMDIGLGHGFRNKFAEAIALERIEDAKKYISTLYSSTTLISLACFILYIIINSFLDWDAILNTPINFDENISGIVFIIFSLFFLQFIFKNITTVLLALQKTALSNAIVFASQLLSLIVILILNWIDYANLKTISIAFMLSPIVVNGFSTLFLFRRNLKKYLHIKIGIDSSSILNMMNLGIKFFFIQITTIIMFSSGNIIITQLYGPSKVTSYNIANQLFSSGISVFTIIIAPFWSAFTEAITKKDYTWIKSTIKKLRLLWLFFVFAVVIVLLFSPIIYNLWIGDKVQISYMLSISFAIYAIILSWTSIYSQFLNGTGKIKLQLIIAIIQCISNIPLAILLAKVFEWGSIGVIMATNINLLLAAIILPIQAHKISAQKSMGIWDK